VAVGAQRLKVRRRVVCAIEIDVMHFELTEMRGLESTALANRAEMAAIRRHAHRLDVSSDN